MHPRILITEENIDMRLLYESVLQKLYDIDFAENGTEVIRKKHKIPDMYLLNSRLPDIPVISLCHNLHQDPATKDIPILILSASEDIDHLSEECPANDYIRKPFNSAELLEKVNKLLSSVNH